MLTKYAGYDIIYDKNFENLKINSVVFRKSAPDTLKKMLQSADLTNYSLVIDEKGRKIRIVAFSAEKQAPTVKAEGTKGTEGTEIAPSEQLFPTESDFAAANAPLSPDYELLPGETVQNLQEYSKEIEQQKTDPNSVFSLSEKDESPITWAELKKKQEEVDQAETSSYTIFGEQPVTPEFLKQQQAAIDKGKSTSNLKEELK